MAEFKLKFNTDKKRYTMIKRRKNITHFPVIKSKKEYIRYVNEIKYLGVIIGKNISRVSHILFE